MAIKRFCKVVIFEGEESLLRSRYSHECSSDGVVCFADGVKRAGVQVDYGDLSAIHPRGLQNILKLLKEVKPVDFEDVKD
jgi:hypothetical protein